MEEKECPEILHQITLFVNSNDKEEENELGSSLEQWLETKESTSDIIFLLKNKPDLDSNIIVVLLSALKRRFMTFESDVSSEEEKEAYELLLKIVKNKEETDQIYSSYVEALSKIALVCYPEISGDFFSIALKMPSLLTFKETIEFVLQSNCFSLMKKNLILDLMHRIFPEIIEVLNSKYLTDSNALSIFEMLSLVVAPDVIYNETVILPLLELLSKAKKELNIVLDCIENIVLKRVDFQTVVDEFIVPVLQSLASISGSSQKAVKLIAKILVKYHDKVPPDELLHKCFKLLIPSSWCEKDEDEIMEEAELNKKFWETWEVLLDFYAVKNQILVREELTALFSSFYESIFSGVDTKEGVLPPTKACLVICSSLINDFVENGFSSLKGEELTPETLFVLTACFQTITPEISSSVIDLAVANSIKDKEVNEDLTSPLVLCVARALFYYPDAESTYDLFYGICSVGMSNPFSPLSYAVITAMTYLARRREHLFTILDFKLVRIITKFLENIEPEMYKTSLVTESVKLVGLATRFVKRKSKLSMLIKPFASKIIDFLTKKAVVFSQKRYESLCEEKMQAMKLSEEEEEEENSMFLPTNKIQTSFFDFDNSGEEDNEKCEDENEEIIFTGVGEKAEPSKTVDEEDDQIMNDPSDTEETLIKKIMSALELIRIISSSSSHAAIAIYFSVAPFCIDFLGDVNEEMEGGLIAIAEIYKTLEVILFNSGFLFNEISDNFKKLIDIATAHPKHAKSFLPLMTKLIPKFPEIQFYLFSCYSSLILPHLEYIYPESATPEALKFLVAASFWDVGLMFPLPALQSFRQFSIHEADAVLEFIIDVLTIPSIEYVTGILQQINLELAQIIFQMLTDGIYNRFFNTAVKALQALISASARTGADRTEIQNMLIGIINELIPQAEEKSRIFIESIIDENDDLMTLYQYTREFLIEHHCCVTSDYGLYKYEREMNAEEVETRSEIPDDDEDEDNWDGSDVEIDEELVAFEEEEKKRLEEKEFRRKLKLEEMRRKEEEERNAPIYFFGGFQIDKASIFAPPEEEEEKNEEEEEEERYEDED